MGDQADAGFYPDPEHAAMMRFWDGSTWTDDRRPIDPAPTLPQTAPATESPVSAAVGEAATDRSPRPWVVGGGIATVVCWPVVLLGGGFGLEAVAPAALIALLVIGVVWRFHHRPKRASAQLESGPKESGASKGARMFGRMLKQTVSQGLPKGDGMPYRGEEIRIMDVAQQPVFGWIRDPKGGGTRTPWRIGKMARGMAWFALCMTFFPVRDALAEWRWSTGGRSDRPLPPR